MVNRLLPLCLGVGGLQDFLARGRGEMSCAANSLGQRSWGGQQGTGMQGPIVIILSEAPSSEGASSQAFSPQ